MSDIPTKEGWYWCRHKYSPGRWVVQYVFYSAFHNAHVTHWNPDTTYIIKEDRTLVWASPCEPLQNPDRQMLTANSATDFVKELAAVHHLSPGSTDEYETAVLLLNSYIDSAKKIMQA